MKNMGLAADVGREREKAYEHLVVKSMGLGPGRKNILFK